MTRIFAFLVLACSLLLIGATFFVLAGEKARTVTGYKSSCADFLAMLREDSVGLVLSPPSDATNIEYFIQRGFGRIFVSFDIDESSFLSWIQTEPSRLKFGVLTKISTPRNLEFYDQTATKFTTVVYEGYLIQHKSAEIKLLFDTREHRCYFWSFGNSH